MYDSFDMSLNKVNCNHFLFSFTSILTFVRFEGVRKLSISSIDLSDFGHFLSLFQGSFFFGGVIFFHILTVLHLLFVWF